MRTHSIYHEPSRLSRRGWTGWWEEQRERSHHSPLPARPPSFLQGVIWFRLVKGPLHLVCGQYFKLNQIEGGDH